MRPVNQCLNKQLAALCEQSIKLNELNEKLKMYLSPSLHEHCSVGSFNRGCLVLALTAPAFATPLRYELPVLRDRLRKEAGFYQLLSIQIKIIEPEVKLSSSIPKKCRPLSDKSRAAIQQAGETCPYPPLKDALYKLAQDDKG
ncbi:DUF721 domain-containing protein [Legionella sp. MW5194]|uniref:DUF721 domain-containing protein n=1 Tax=Legionella sp. MW5194 TaxID=2662448 RepID=UPI00193D86C7|nr:DUF721 domain-containing protein [Legionella sp. MW5194]QRN02765.1 DUF721 domain-containing protein [Legionella sp. MW5194]